MKATIETIVSFIGCTPQVAEEALHRHNGDIYKVMSELLEAPVVSGAKYIPKPREIDRGRTPEQEQICATGRALMDKLTAVASAAHSKIRSGQSLAGGAVQEVSPVRPLSLPEAETSVQPQ